VSKKVSIAANSMEILKWIFLPNPKHKKGNSTMEQDFEHTTRALVPLKKEEPMVIAPASSFLDRLLNKPLYLPGATQIGPGQSWTTDFSEMANFLRMQGVPNGHLKPALAMLVGLNSANLENAIAIEIIDNEEKSGGRILDTCLALIPKTFWAEFKTIPKDFFIQEREQLKGKVIVNHDSDQFGRVTSDLNTLLVQQELESTQTIFGKYGPVTQDTSVKGPVGFISIAKDEESCVLSHPSCLKIRLPSGEPPQDLSIVFDPKGVLEAQRNQFMMGLQRVIASMKRIRPQPVIIPYNNVLLNHFSKTKNGHKAETFLNALRIITMIAHPPAVSREEQLAKVWECNIEMIETATGKKVFRPGTLVATKREYYILRVIFSDLAQKNTENGSLTDRQKRIFKVIMGQNLAALEGGSLANPDAPPHEKLNTIRYANQTWASQEEIFEGLNKDGGDPMGSTSTFYRELQEMEKHGFIKGEKDPGAKNRIGYYVTTFDSQDTVSLPHPSEIEDPVLGREKIRIQNPITGEIDEV